MPTDPSSAAELTAELRHVRAEVVAGYRQLGPEVAPTAWLNLRSRDAKGRRLPHADELLALLEAEGTAAAVGREHVLTAAFRHRAMRDDPDATWLTRRVPSATAARWRWVARRRELADLAGAALTAGDVTFALRMAAEATTADPAQAQLVTGAVPATALVVRLLTALADGPALRADEVTVIAAGVATPALG